MSLKEGHTLRQKTKVMNNKRLISWIPEVYLIASAVYYWTLTAQILNPVAICLVAMLTIQIAINNRIFGLVIGILFLLINFFMFFALSSEVNDFPEFNDKARNLLLIGSIYLGLNLCVGLVLVIKYSKKKITFDPSTQSN